jgi:hypothetical protein
MSTGYPVQIGECLPLRVPSQSSKKENIFEIFATDRDVGSSFSLLNIADNVGFTLTFLLVASSSQAKMCPERLPEPANAGPQAGGRRASLARSGRAHDPTEWSCAQQVKLVV